MAFVDMQNRPQGERIDAIAPRKLKLSEAIRIGAKIRPQCEGLFWRNGGSCAMGAALEAVGIEYGKKENVGSLIHLHFPGVIGAVGNEILIRNDRGESRESIAIWLESLGL